MPLLSSVCVIIAAKKHHPDVSPGDAEFFKKVTSAYSQALLISAKRGRDPQRSSTAASRAGSSSGGGTSSSNFRYGSTQQGAQQQRTSYYGGFGPSAYTGRPSVDGSRFNVREWDKQHYGLHGATAEQRQSEYIRNLMRAQRQRDASAAAHRAARQQARQQARRGANGLGVFVFSIAACSAVWSAVAQTNSRRFR